MREASIRSGKSAELEAKAVEVVGRRIVHARAVDSAQQVLHMLFDTAYVARESSSVRPPLIFDRSVKFVKPVRVTGSPLEDTPSFESHCDFGDRVVTENGANRLGASTAKSLEDPCTTQREVFDFCVCFQ